MAVYLILNEMPRFAAITLVAPTVRFSALAILLAPFLSFAIVFNNRTSFLVQRRKATFFFLLATLDFLFSGMTIYHTHSLAIQRPIFIFKRVRVVELLLAG
jgi:hypothetical protein